MATKKPTAAPKADTQVDFGAMVKTLQELRSSMEFTSKMLDAKANVARDQSDALDAAVYDIGNAIESLTSIEVD